jgi:hypothetical protein
VLDPELRVRGMENLRVIEDRLTKTHGFPLSEGDREGIRWALSNFYRFGPAISYGSSLSAGAPPAIVGSTGGGGRGSGATYADLMTADDGQGSTAVSWRMKRTLRTSRTRRLATLSCRSSATSAATPRSARLPAI